jgi:hypothetical protein
MDILNFISWIKGGRVVTSVNPTQTLLPVGLKDPKRDDGYLTGAITVDDFAQSVAPFITPGPAGPQGVAGPAGVPGPVGPAGLEWQGTWVSGTSYVLDDAVGYSGASYYCILATSGTTAPNVDTTHWALLASQGAIGPQGPQGPAGAQGPSGNPIAWLEYNAQYKSVWNNGFGNFATNTSFGDQAIASMANGDYNTAMGYFALRNTSYGSGNTAIGGVALANSQGTYNTAIGAFAGLGSSGATSNGVYVGAFAGYNCNGDYNTSIGTYSSQNNSTGESNTVVGFQALNATSGATASNNTAIGKQTMYSATTAYENVAVGGAALSALSTGFQNTVVGFGAANVNSTGSRNTVVGNSAQTGNYNGSVIIGVDATATAANQFVIGSTTTNAGAVTAGAPTPASKWKVKINGVDYYIPLQTV